MTTRTVTINTPEEQEVVICDECGLGDDAGELVEFTPADGAVDADLHYHRSCAKELSGNSVTVREAFHDAVGAEMEYQIAFVLTKIGFTVFLFGLLAFTGGAILTAHSLSNQLPVADTLAWVTITGVGAVLAGVALMVGRDNGQKTAEELV